jgi:nucleoside-diphosphate-sugar epimerase
MRILVTGAGGFIGGALAHGLMATRDHEVIGMYCKTLPDLKVPGLKMQQCDLTYGVNLDGPVDFIVHCAALQEFEGIPVNDYVTANLAIIENVARYGKQAGVKGVIFASSISLHGEITCGVVDEHTDRTNPTVYGISKYLCEAVLQDYEAYFPVVALRLCGVVGRGAKNIWLSKVRALAERGEDITIFNPDKQFNNILHTDDLLHFLLLLIEKGFTGFNAFPVASIESLSMRDVVNEIVEGLNSHSRIIDKGPSGNPFLISSEYAINRFGYIPSKVLDSLRKFTVSAV